ncbi:MAG TPA: PilT/PilU family type 4a pilus ATPase [Steroidobacteraceae bacterium]|jgi:twitching motility protein PilU|nr:PilT/PilU family type 4a pilus ATPase [Steroidobacteraceae bacterium]
MTLTKDAEPKPVAPASLSSLEATGTYTSPNSAATGTYATPAAAATGPHPQLNTKPLFKLMVEKKASDLFFTCNAPIKIKIEGQIFPVNKQVLSPETVRQTALALMTAEQRERFAAEFEIDFAISEPGLGRFRVNVFQQRGYPAIVLRYITADMPRLDSLGLPEVLSDLALLKRGLVLVVGATGSGKSTTLASMINLRNETASDHIITIEDPIEFLHTNKRSIINQREVGLDTKSYARALRGSMRAAPDVILIGEVRDRESMEAAINLAGTGHLVLATLHANNCAETMDRIINMFPPEQHKQIFLDMSQYLKAILAQRLVMGKDNRRVAAMEVMLNTPHMQELVKKGDVIGIKEAIAASSERGIQSFDVALFGLCKDGRVEMAEALAHADSRANLEAKINFG